MHGVSLSSPFTPRPSYSTTQPITSLCPVYEGLQGGITLHGETLSDKTEKEALLINHLILLFQVKLGTFSIKIMISV